MLSSPALPMRCSRRHTDTLGNTGNNTSYEGATSNAAGGTGYNSGQPATGETMNANSGYDAAGVWRHTENDEDENKTQEEKDIS